MDKRKAKHLGGKFGLRAVTGGLFMAQIVMTIFFYNNNKSDGILKAFFWFTETNFWLSLVTGISVLYICGYFYGQFCGRQVLINHKNYNLVGFKYALFALLVPTVSASFINFLIVGIDKVGQSKANPIVDSFLTPIPIIFLFGLVPALLMGYWFGKQLRRRLRF